LNVPEVCLVFAPVVLAELDRHKWSGSRREKTRAKAVLKALDELSLSTEPVVVRPGVTALAIASEPVDGLFAGHRLQPAVQDDRLLASLLGFREAHGTGDRVVLLSADGGLRVKARARQIEVVVPDDALAIEDEPDDIERQLAAVTRELAARSAVPELRLTIDGDTHVDGEVRLATAFGAGTLRRLLEEWRSRYPHVSAMRDTIQMPGGHLVSAASLMGYPGFYSEKDAAKHNAPIDEVFKNYEQFLSDWPSLINQYRRTIAFKFVLENSGTAPADDVHVQLWTEAEGNWLRKRHALPRPPMMPKPYNPFDTRLDYGLLHSPAFNMGLQAPDRNMHGPAITNDDRQRVEYWTKRVTHHVPCAFSRVHFQFRSDEAVRSFSINYRLVAANIREPITRALHIKLSVTEGEAPAPSLKD
jgi:hypothetical protein